MASCSPKLEYRDVCKTSKSFSFHCSHKNTLNFLFFIRFRSLVSLLQSCCHIYGSNLCSHLWFLVFIAHIVAKPEPKLKPLATPHSPGFMCWNHRLYIRNTVQSVRCLLTITDNHDNYQNHINNYNQITTGSHHFAFWSKIGAFFYLDEQAWVSLCSALWGCSTEEALKELNTRDFFVLEQKTHFFWSNNKTAQIQTERNRGSDKTK